MRGIRSAAIATLVASTLALGTASTSLAGVLNGHGDAFNAIAGTVPFNNGTGLSGTVDYAVFTSAAFNSNFAGLGYVPGDSLVYTFQVFSQGSVAVTGFELLALSDANTIGSFDIGNVPPTSSAFVGLDAQWLFAAGIPGGQSSWGLAFSSSVEPIVAFFEILGAPEALLAAGLPKPFGVADVPEPNAVGAILAAALAGLGWLRRRRRAS